MQLAPECCRLSCCIAASRGCCCRPLQGITLLGKGKHLGAQQHSSSAPMMLLPVAWCRMYQAMRRVPTTRFKASHSFVRANTWEQSSTAAAHTHACCSRDLVQDAPKPPAGRQHGSYIQAACNCMAQWPPGVDAKHPCTPCTNAAMPGTGRARTATGSKG